MALTARTERFLSAGRPYLTDGGLETAMIFHEGFDLPAFAAFTLLDSAEGRAALEGYFDRHVALAAGAGTGFVLDTVTWRANAPWIARMGLAPETVGAANRRAAEFAEGLRARHERAGLPIVVNGVVGPSGDGYAVGENLAPGEAADRHRPQIAALAEAGVDLVTAVTVTHAGEGAGVALAARDAGLPVAVSFTVETDGRLPSGQALAEAVAEVEAETGAAPVYYMVNCAHPDHFGGSLAGAGLLARLGGLRANASRLSHAELDAAETLDDGDPDEFGRLHRPFLERLPALKVIGGCCGTDHRHVGAVGACLHAGAA